MRTPTIIHLLTLLCILTACSKKGTADPSEPPPSGADTGFTNPITPDGDPDDFADPSLVYFSKYYYYVRSSHGSSQIDIYKAARLEDIYYKGAKTTVWTAPSSGDHSKAIWAPELQYIRGSWYIYYTATTSDGSVNNHRMFVLKSSSPTGPYTDMGILTTGGSGYAIDGAVMIRPSDSALYFVWSGGLPSQRLYIATMDNPTHINSTPVMLGHDMKSWESDLNEAPAFLYRNGKTFIAYSTGDLTSGSAITGYKLGLMSNATGDYMDPNAWVKSATPALQYYSGYDGTVYAPGSNTFVRSPDSSEDWIVYHAKHSDAGGVYDRELHTQKFTWDADGFPVFGHPIPPGVMQRFPAGE
jgi:GH43 family beta-xylosidase